MNIDGERDQRTEDILSRLCDDLREFADEELYIHPSPNEGPGQERNNRRLQIKRNIKAAKVKKREFEEKEEQLRILCERASVSYDPPNEMEEHEVRRERLRALAMEELALKKECSQAQVKYRPHTLDENDMIRRERLRDEIFEFYLKKRCEDNGVFYLAPCLPQESKEAARIRREGLEELIKRFVHFETCAAPCPDFLHSFCQFAL